MKPENEVTPLPPGPAAAAAEAAARGRATSDVLDVGEVCRREPPVLLDGPGDLT
jgi:hypothetical protein